MGGADSKTPTPEHESFKSGFGQRCSSCGQPEPDCTCGTVGKQNEVLTGDVKAYQVHSAYLDLSQECCICMTQQANVVLQPCGHSDMCEQCLKGLVGDKTNFYCPKCRQVVYEAYEVVQDAMALPTFDMILKREERRSSLKGGSNGSVSYRWSRSRSALKGGQRWKSALKKQQEVQGHDDALTEALRRSSEEEKDRLEKETQERALLEQALAASLEMEREQQQKPRNMGYTLAHGGQQSDHKTKGLEMLPSSSSGSSSSGLKAGILSTKPKLEARSLSLKHP